MSQTQQQLQHADSIPESDNAPDDKKKQKSRRPPNTAFRQQRLRAWQPILTPKTVLPLFFAVGIIFAPIGGLLLWANSQVQEISIDYSNCPRVAQSTYAPIPNGRVSSSFKGTTTTQQVQWRADTNQTVTYPHGVSTNDTNICYLTFTIPNDLKPPVLLYYQLTNFYQNHRRYVKSFDQNQLKGDAREASVIKDTDCNPIRNDNATGLPYYPCGLIANSIFNDTISNPSLLNSQGGSNSSTNYTMTTKGIAWSSDSKLYGKTKYALGKAVPPPNWVRKYPNYDNYIPDLATDESFWVWMRTAGLPSFSKLAMRNDNETMLKGQYEIAVWDEFNTTLYSGTKSILITTRTVMGGKNPFLGIAYIVVGGLCILLGAIFTATHLIKPRKLGDHTYLTWDKEPSARTTGRAPRAGENAS